MASGSVQIDETYEFSAPRFFDFTKEETQDEIRRAEIWFEISHSHAPSPFMPKIKKERAVKIETLCNFDEVEMKVEKDAELRDQNMQQNDRIGACQGNAIQETRSQDLREETESRKSISFDYVPKSRGDACGTASQEPNKAMSVIAESSREEIPCFEFPVQLQNEMDISIAGLCTPKLVPATVHKLSVQPIHASGKGHMKVETVTCMPGDPANETGPSNSKKQTAKKIASAFMNQSIRKTPLPLSQKNTGYRSLIKSQNGKLQNPGAHDMAQENQAVKRQKLDGGRTRQILNVKPVDLAHKCTAPKRTQLSTSLKGNQFVSAAEVIKRFESGTRDLGISQNKKLLPHDDSSQTIQRPRLVLTRPKEPELQTSQRVRAVRMKSSEELEAEMLAKMPKFKARPLNKKILQAPPLPPVLNKSTHQPPEFKEFNFKTSERASRHDTCSETSSVAGFTFQSQSNPLKLTEPRPPRLETSLRARPPKVKSSQELELEELEKAPKFKARPLNRKILHQKVETISTSVSKPPLTTPKEFHFATDERLGPASASVLDQFEKLSLHSDTSFHSQKLSSTVPGLTIPNPFHLHTEERGLQKEVLLQTQLTCKQEEEEKARIPKATPYPYTTDYPVVPPKPEPKPCTKPEGFQLESLVRHEEEMRRKMEERERMEREEVQRRIYRAQPVLTEDPLPVPAKERKPLTEVQTFALHVDQRSIQRQEFDNKIKEKEVMYKRLREEAESSKLMEEEKAMKQLRRTMVPHARPLPKFEKPFIPQRSTKEATKPKSPHLHVDERGQIRRQKTHTFFR
ncbi:TPX2 (targeting protein for Xklp2) protein family [Rhynchospora pubera]|uniref:TPX2 (Targeting protein for Xklp2) protein family n=1 Tax=Rhynchospora pubera TaxID=906938 RepID=A0AAV8ENX9_9POAL|nr:TPX2 (targeting protein for Xklp2) protein family [Rhynchospora pubera]